MEIGDSRKLTLLSFNSILTLFLLQKCILNNCEKLIDLICYKLPDACLPLLDILAIVYNPDNKFHIFTSTRAGVESSSVKGQQQQPGIEGAEEVYAECTDQRNARP